MTYIVTRTDGMEPLEFPSNGAIQFKAEHGALVVIDHDAPQGSRVVGMYPWDTVLQVQRRQADA